MSFQLSPGVKVKEIDLTTIVPAVATSEAAIGGVFRWGPLEQPILVSNENQLVERFGRPTNLNAETFFSAASFLAYSNALYVSRAGKTEGVYTTETVEKSGVWGNDGPNQVVIVGVDLTDIIVPGLSVTGTGVDDGTTVTKVELYEYSGDEETVITLSDNVTTVFEIDGAPQKADYTFEELGLTFNAIAQDTGTADVRLHIVKNEADFELKEGSFDSDVEFIAKYPGELGNSLAVSVCTSAKEFARTAEHTLRLTVGEFEAKIEGDTGETLDITDINKDIIVGDVIRVEAPGIGEQFLKVQNISSVATIQVRDEDDELQYEYDEVTLTFDQRFSLGEDLTVNSFEVLWGHWSLVDGAPGQTVYQQQKGDSSINDEMHIVVVDKGGRISGIPGTVLEVFQGVSRATDCKTLDGASNFWRDVINDRSRFMWAINDVALADSAPAQDLKKSTRDFPLYLDFTGGGDSLNEAEIATAELIRAYNEYKSAEDIDISLIIAGKARGGHGNSTLVNYLVDNIAEHRMDCVVFASPPRGDVVDNVMGDTEQKVVAFRNRLRSTSYAVLDSGYKYMYDKYNDLYRWVPMNGDTAGLCARTDHERDAWWSPAGFNRGHIRNVVKLAWNPNKAQRDVLYKNGINPIVNFPGQGIVMYGDKTLLAKPSAFDRINVRRLFIVLEKAIATAAKFTLFEFNDEFTRASFVNMVVPFLRDVQGRRGIHDFRVVCDETNNTGEVIDRNEFIGDIYIKPARSINFITLNFVAVRTGVEFEEVIGQF